MSRIRGIFGRPFVPLDHRLDLTALDAVHEEVCLALTRIPVDYTGGSHRSMGIVPASRRGEVLVDYGEVIRSMTDAQFAVFRELAEDPEAIDAEVARSGRAGRDLAFGEERDHPLSRRQMLWLKFRFGVYFPWKVYVELIPNRYWGEKSAPKDFTRVARALFPRTVAFVQSLPFVHIGRCNVMGLEANDHGTVHHDGPADGAAPLRAEPDHFITVCPAGNKRLFLWDEGAKEKTYVTGRAYWFDDHDHHGVDPDPFFRYSIRVDGVFRPDFLEELRHR